MLHSLFRLFHNAIRCLSTSATMWHIFNSLRAILSELQPLFVRQYLVVILTMFSSLFTCLTMFFHCFGPLLPFLYFSYLGHFDHVALTFQVFFTFDVSDHVFFTLLASATTFYIFLTLVILTMLHSLFRFSSLFTCLTMFFHCFGLCYHFLYFSYLGHFDHVALSFQVFFTFVVSDHVFSLFWHLLPLFIFFLPWSFWPCCTHFSGWFTMQSGVWVSSATMWHKFKSVRAILSELQPLFVC